MHSDVDLMTCLRAFKKWRQANVDTSVSKVPRWCLIDKASKQQCFWAFVNGWSVSIPWSSIPEANKVRIFNNGTYIEVAKISKKRQSGYRQSNESYSWNGVVTLRRDSQRPVKMTTFKISNAPYLWRNLSCCISCLSLEFLIGTNELWELELHFFLSKVPVDPGAWFSF